MRGFTQEDRSDPFSPPMPVTDAMIMGSDFKGKKRWKRFAVTFVVGPICILCYLGLLLFSPEVGSNHIRGPVILNVSGAGYARGDVVWLSGPQGECDPTTAVMYDWRAINSGGFGPRFAIAAFGTLDARQREQIHAVVRFRLGHDPFRARSYSKRVY